MLLSLQCWCVYLTRGVPMSRVRAGKIFPKNLYPGDTHANELIHAYKSAKRLAIAKKDRRWKLAREVAINRKLLIGAGRMFKHAGAK